MAKTNASISRQTGFAPILLFFLVIVLGVGIAIGYFFPRYQLVEKPASTSKVVTPTPVEPTEKSSSMEENSQAPSFTQNAAATLAETALGSCSCGSRIVTVDQQGSVWYMTVVDDKLADDSNKAKRIYAPVNYQNGVWTMGAQSVSYQCWPGRGHQEFSSSPCQ